jgi:N-acetylmuramoyl-L-alanine amidase
MVLKSPDILSLLVETAYISNPEEEGRLGNRAFRQKLAGAIRDGIMSYFDEHGVTAARSAQARGDAGHQHWVNPGETLSGIALHYAVSAERIRLANNLDTDTVRVGELLHIP